MDKNNKPKQRRRNGEGSIRRRNDGRWEGRVYVNLMDGTRKRISIMGKTYEEVRDKMADVTVQNRKELLPAQNWRLDGYLDYWLESTVKIHRRANTYAQCESVSRLYLKPGLGRYQLKELTVQIAQKFFNQQIDTGHSVVMVHIMRKVLSSALTYANHEDLLNRNVARLVRLPTIEPREIVPWTSEEAHAFLRIAKGNAWYPAFVVMLYCGLRRGEVLGLSWTDIDFERGCIRVRHQAQRNQSLKHLELAPLKTKAGRRDLAMPDVVRKELVAHREQQVRRGAQITEDSLVFPNTNGQLTEASVLVKAFKMLCTRHDIRLIRVHDIRHTTATFLKSIGVPVRDTQLIMGHARISTTQEIYEHDTFEERRASLEKLEKFLTGNEEESLPA